MAIMGDRTVRALAILDFIEAQPHCTAVVTSTPNLLTMIDLGKCYGEIRIDNDTDAHVWRLAENPTGRLA